jgi:hypothetical protein
VRDVYVAVLVHPSFDWEHAPTAVKELDEGGTTGLSSYIYIDGVFKIFANANFTRMTGSTADDLNGKMVQESQMPVFVWAG